MDESLLRLGLGPYVARQVTPEELADGRVVRVVEVQRSGLSVSDGAAVRPVVLSGDFGERSPEERPTTGDWVVLDERREKVLRLLERKSVFRRLAAGTRLDVQLIAANIDTLFVVTSCNEDCNESRLERYLALAAEAGVDPVIVLTKADLVDDVDVYRERVRSLRADLPIEIVNALDPDTLRGLLAWVSAGATVALVGSSGVGKSTILNTLLGDERAETAAIREQDARGRHTTTFRSLHLLPDGGILLDVPGMRELKVTDVAEALGEVFAEIEALAKACRFRDCGHDAEPGCRVRQAIESGDLDSRRLENYRKLRREDARNALGLAERRKRERRFGKVIRQHLDLKRETGRKHPAD